MSHEREHERAHRTADHIQRDVDPTVSRETRSSQLDAPANPITSGLVQRKARDANGVAGDADAAVASASNSSGSSLPATLMRKFEASLGADLSSVRVHTGGASETAAHAVGAKAYTMGQDIHFGAGHYDPSSPAGEHLLAHEVAHTVQQRGGSPTRQNKLEVSAPGDHLEHEADSAADAMVAGAPASVGSASGLARQVIMRDAIKGPDIMAPNASKQGVAYSIPTTDYHASVHPAAPALTQEMPPAALGDPGPIPGWKVVIPGKESTFGPFKYVDPPQEVVVTGQNHSPDMLTAWEDYKRETVKGVADTWDRDTRARMNTYAQQANSDPELDKLVADMKTTYRMTNVGQKGKGTVSDQAGQTNVVDGQNATQIAGALKGKGADFQKDLAATASAGQNGTVGGPVGAIVDELKAARMASSAAATSFAGFQTQFDGATITLQNALLNAEIADLNTKIDDEKQKQEEIKNGQASLKKYAPEIAGIVNLWTANKEQFSTVGKMVKAVPGALERDPEAILELGKGLFEVLKWDAIEKSQRTISQLTDTLKLKYKLSNAAAIEGALKSFDGLRANVKAAALALQASLLKEKGVMNRLADAVKTNWQGGDKNDGALASRAIHAMPIVSKVLRTLGDMKSAMPKLPDVGTRAAQGFTLATQGVGAPGAADMLKVAGWIAGSPAAIEPEIQKWTQIYAQLQIVTGGLGV